jgi:hypothetical protein
MELPLSLTCKNVPGEAVAMPLLVPVESEKAMQATRILEEPIGHMDEQEKETPEQTPAPEGTLPPNTALTPTEEPIIEGVVTAIIEPEETTTPKKPPYYLLIVSTILICLLFVVASLVIPLLTPTATITIIPVERTISATGAIQVQGRLLPSLTLIESTNAPATGKRHQNATQAQGSVTFYNGLLTGQTIAAGTILTGADGVQVITDEAAGIPAANPPSEGQVTVAAHAVLAGSQGNIAAYDINKACCAISVLAKNTTAFTGGAEARDYLIVSRGDINKAVTTLITSLSQSELAALQAQLHSGEGLITPTCNPHVTTNHQPGDEAKEVTISAPKTCSGIAYDSSSLREKAMQHLTQAATTKLGHSYAIIGDIQISIVKARITDYSKGVVSISTIADGVWVYRISPGEKQQLAKLMAGKSKRAAIRMLLSIPGIQGVQITTSGGDNANLPDDPRNIHIVMFYRST